MVQTFTPDPDKPLCSEVGNARRYGLALITFFFAALVMWGTFVPVAQAILASGTLRAQSPNVEIRYQSDGVLHKMLTTDGDQVKVGQIIAEMDTSKLRLHRETTRRLLVLLQLEKKRLQHDIDSNNEFDVGPSLAAEISELQMQDAFLLERQQQKLNHDAHRREMRAIETRLKGLTEATKRLTEQLGYETRQIASAKSVMESFEGLRTGGRITATDFEKAQRTYLGLQAKAAETHADLAHAQLALDQATHDSKRVSAEKRAMRAERIANLDRLILTQRLALARTTHETSATKIRSPIDGTVLSSRFSMPGSIVPKDEVMMVIVPRGAPLIEVEISPAAINMIALGSTAQISLATDILNAASSLRATVVRISADTFRSDNAGLYYKAILEFDRNDFDTFQLRTGSTTEIRLGMPIRAQFEVGSQTFLSYLIEPLRRAMEDSFNR